MDVFGQLKKAQLENTATDPDKRGQIILDTDDTKVKYYDGGAVRTVVNTNEAQTLTTKTIVVASNTITTAASGNLTSTELNAALDELQDDIDTRALDSALTAHMSDTSTHGVGEVIGATEAQALTNKTIDADANTITNIENADIKAAAAIAVNKLAALTASRAVVSDGSGFLTPATTTATEIGYVNGVTSAIQTQIDTKKTDSMSTARLLGRTTASTGAIEEISMGSGLSLAATVLSVVGQASAVVDPKTTTFTASATKDVYLISTAGGAYTGTLPTAVGNEGKTFSFIKTTTDDNAFTLEGDGAETINLLLNLKLTKFGEYITIVSDNANWKIKSIATKAEVYLDTANGYGSTNNKIPRYTNTQANYGSALTYADSAANGASVTINEAGLYCAEMMVSELVGAMWIGISVNGSGLTTSIATTTYAQGKRAAVFAVINRGGYVASTFSCAVGDVIRPHTDGAAQPVTTNSIFKVTKIST